MLKRNYYLLRDKDDDGSRGPDDKTPPPSQPNDELEALKISNAELLAKVALLDDKKIKDDGDLIEKAKQQRELDDKSKNDSSALETALRFEMQSKDWIKQNQSLLPKDIGEIFKAAESEKYDSILEKDAALKSGIVQTFFSEQTNVDLLTPSLKIQLEDYLKLTKTAKEARAQSIYNNIFEPTFEMLKRVKKAESLSKGLGGGDDDEYKNRLIKLSNKHYLGVE